MSRNFFLFNIFATLLILSALGTACQSSDTDNSGQGDHAEATEVKALYRLHCATCHGADGKLGLNGAGDLTQVDQGRSDIRQRIAPRAFDVIAILLPVNQARIDIGIGR